MAQKHFEDQARKTRDEDYGHNIPFPADHSGECNDAGEDGERIDRSRAWKDHVQPKQTPRFSTTPTPAAVTAESIRWNLSPSRSASWINSASLCAARSRIAK